MANLVAFGKANFPEKPRFNRPIVVFGTKTSAISSFEQLPLARKHTLHWQHPQKSRSANPLV